MGKLFFDYTSGQWMEQVDDNTAIGMDGSILYRDGDHLALDSNSGTYHDTTGWDEDSE